MVHVYCVFDKCGNSRKKNGKISFFSFPKEADLLQKWLKFINQHNKSQLTAGTLDRDRMKLCHLHFEKNQVAVKSNSDRVLIRNSIPRCPPGIVDKAHALQRYKTTKKAKKTKLPKSPSSQENKSDLTGSAPPPVEGAPLYHTINGYVVDLRIAALQETFRLPNGKLIQVRRQPKKGDDSGVETPPKSPAAPPQPPPPPQSKPADKVPSTPQTKASAKPAAVQPTEPTERPVLDTPSVPSIATRSSVVLPPPPTTAHTAKPSKTYASRRSSNQPPRTATTFRTAPPPSSDNQSSNTRPTPVVYPPSLSALQALMHKTHDDTPFGTHLKDFEDRLITIAEISMHVVNKINILLNSASFKSATESRDVKYLYHTVGYMLEYALGRLNGVEESCIQDIQKMGFTKDNDLGPFRSKRPETETQDQAPPAKPVEQKSPEPPQPESSASEKDEAEAEDDDDDDCAIIEKRPEIIEVESDDESDDDGDDNGSERNDQTADPASISLNPRQLRICSDTESIDQDHDEESSSDVPQSKKPAPQNSKANEEEKETAATEKECEEETPNEEAQSALDETTEIEVVMNEVEETTTIVHDYYYEAYSDEEIEDVQVNQDTIETMVVDDDDDEGDDDDSSNSRTEQEQGDGDEEETEELIEIIEGDIDLELEEGQEYKVIEVVDGDVDGW